MLEAALALLQLVLQLSFLFLEVIYSFPEIKRLSVETPFKVLYAFKKPLLFSLANEALLAWLVPILRQFAHHMRGFGAFLP